MSNLQCIYFKQRELCDFYDLDVIWMTMLISLCFKVQLVILEVPRLFHNFIRVEGSFIISKVGELLCNFEN